MGNHLMRENNHIPSITVNGVIVPVLNEPIGILGAAFAPNMNIWYSYYVTNSLSNEDINEYEIFKEMICFSELLCV